MGMPIGSLRGLLIALTVLGVAWPVLTSTTDAQGLIPFVDRDPVTGEIRVGAPFVRVDTGPAGTRVRAPFTRYRSGRYVFPYADIEAAPLRPPVADVVRLEIDASVRVVIPAGRQPSQPGEAVGIPPAPQLGESVPALGEPAPLGPSLGEPAAFPGAPEPTDNKEASPKPASPPKKEQPSKPEPAAPKTAPSYLVIPLRESDRIPEVRVTILKSTQPSSPAPLADEEIPPPPPPAAKPAPKPAAAGPSIPAPVPEETEEIIIQARSAPKPVADGPSIPPPVPEEAEEIIIQARAESSSAESPKPVPRKNGKSVYELAPMWHTEVPRFFEPIGGLHVFAVVHPYTSQTVCVQVILPEGRPRLEVDRNDVEFHYGRYEVEIDFKRDGRVDVKYDD